jgi:hypothetical protein
LRTDVQLGNSVEREPEVRYSAPRSVGGPQMYSYIDQPPHTWMGGKIAVEGAWYRDRHPTLIRLGTLPIETHGLEGNAIKQGRPLLHSMKSPSVV